MLSPLRQDRLAHSMRATSIKSVLMHAPRVWGGGVEPHVYELTLELLARNIEVTLAVCTRFGFETGRRGDLLASGAELVDTRGGDHNGVNRILDQVSSSVKLSRLGRFDSIICHGTGMSHVLAMAKRHKARLVWHDHCSGGEAISNEQEFSPPRLKHYPWLFRMFLDKVDAVITGNQRGRENLRNFQLVKSQIHVIPPLFRVPKPQTLLRPQRSPVITCGAFGNLGPEKGTEPLLRLWSHPDLSHIRLLLFGNDPEGRYERIANSLGLKNVEFRGPYMQKSFALYAAEVDFAVIASVSEGYALVAIELMACGVPLVATKVGVCSQLDCSGKSVILVEHDAESVRSGILRMVQQIEKGVVDRDAIRQRANESYDRQSIVDQYLRVFGV
jgi:glycosyltransferase involved in cell wall biosynthesis